MSLALTTVRSLPEGSFYRIHVEEGGVWIFLHCSLPARAIRTEIKPSALQMFPMGNNSFALSPDPNETDQLHFLPTGSTTHAHPNWNVPRPAHGVSLLRTSWAD